MVFFLYIVQKRGLISVGLAVSEMEHFMNDTKVIQKFQSKIPGTGDSDEVETTFQFPQGAHLILFPSAWEILFLNSVSLHLKTKINGPITYIHLKRQDSEIVFLHPAKNCAKTM